MTLSPTQRDALSDVDETGRVRGTKTTVRALVRLGLAEAPHYSTPQSGPSWARITDKGRRMIPRRTA